jgi:hypothetical protein
MERWKERLEVATNVAILCVCLLIAYLGVTRFLLPSASQGINRNPVVGTTLTAAGMDWSRADRNLVLALSTQCHFCSESAPFYKKLLELAPAKQIRSIAVLPQPIEESRRYLESLGVEIKDLKQLPLNSIGVGATPTILLIDGKGVILKAWVGKLPGQSEAEVLAQLQ